MPPELTAFLASISAQTSQAFAAANQAPSRNAPPSSQPTDAPAFDTVLSQQVARDESTPAAAPPQTESVNVPRSSFSSASGEPIIVSDAAALGRNDVFPDEEGAIDSLEEALVELGEALEEVEAAL